jgi:hypothetical protein
MPGNYDIILDEHDAGLFLGGEASPISIRTMQRKRTEGTGPAFIKIGQLVRYLKSDLEEYLLKCRKRSTSDE